jgi:polysaccharide pyruvyl transferase CsaB
MSRRYKAALAGYYGFGNLGDELLAEAAIASLLRCGVPRERLILLSADPEGARRSFGVDAANRWKFAQVWEALGQSETLLFGGGGLFQDATSLRSCLYYWALARLAKLQGAVPWGLGQSVGPLSTRAGRFLTREALKLCRILQVRDGASLDVCTSLGLFAVELGRDPVLSLGGIFGPARLDPPQKTHFLVNLRPCAGGLPERFAKALCGAAVPCCLGVALAEADERLMSDLIGRGCLPSMPVERVRSPEDAVRVWGSASGAVGMRLHFAALSVLARVPLAVVPYDPKVESFAEAHGIPQWCGGALPLPALADFPASAGEAARGELDAFCLKGLL